VKHVLAGLAFVVLAVCNLFANGDVKMLADLASGHRLTAIAHNGLGTLVCVGRGGTMIRSTDGGNTWNQIAADALCICDDATAHAPAPSCAAHDAADTNTASSNSTSPAARHTPADSFHCVATTPSWHTSALASHSVASIIPHDCVTANLGHTLTPEQMYLLGRIRR
jgi:hypothetical protein